MITEEELVDAALLRYAQQRATRWGAERFRAEFERRDLEERWLDAARRNATPYTPVHASTGPAVPAGPVDASAQDLAIGPELEAFRLTRPAYERHPSVPRPPAQEPAPSRRRALRRKPRRPADDPARYISPAEAARMSAAGRRLYGLEPTGR